MRLLLFISKKEKTAFHPIALKVDQNKIFPERDETVMSFDRLKQVGSQ